MPRRLFGYRRFLVKEISFGVHCPQGDFCAPHTMLSMSAYGEESSSRPSSGDCENI